MGIKLIRKKRRNITLSLAYRIGRLIPLSSQKKLKLFLDLSWIFSRLAHEQLFKTDISLKTDNEKDLLLSFIAQDSTVLDLGCGEGYVIKRLLNRTKNITGIDYDENSLEVAKSNLRETGVTLIFDNILNYVKNNPGIKFDYVVLSHVLEHIDEPQLFLNSLKAISRYFYIEVPDFESTHLNLYRQKIDTDLVYSDADHVSEFDRNELEDIITQCNLQIIKSEFRFGVMKFWCENDKSHYKLG
jgi:SAM-dependent methyltransferase